MNDEAKTATKAIGELLIPIGFSRKGRTWIRRLDHVVQVVELQRSNWGPQDYLNLGLWLTSVVEPPKVVREKDCHIRIRVSEVLPVHAASALERALNYEGALAEEDRSLLIVGALREGLIPVLQQLSSEPGLRSAKREGMFARGFVTKSAKESLNEF